MLRECRRWRIEGIGEGQLSGNYPERQPPASQGAPAVSLFRRSEPSSHGMSGRNSSANSDQIVVSPIASPTAQTMRAGSEVRDCRPGPNPSSGKRAPPIARRLRSDEPQAWRPQSCIHGRTVLDSRPIGCGPRPSAHLADRSSAKHNTLRRAMHPAQPPMAAIVCHGEKTSFRGKTPNDCGAEQPEPAGRRGAPVKYRTSPPVTRLPARPSLRSFQIADCSPCSGVHPRSARG